MVNRIETDLNNRSTFDPDIQVLNAVENTDQSAIRFQNEIDKSINLTKSKLSAKGWVHTELLALIKPFRLPMPLNYTDQTFLLFTDVWMTYFRNYFTALVGKIPTASSLSDLTSVSFIAAVNEGLISMHIARGYYCQVAKTATGSSKDLAELKKAYVTRFLEWFAAAYNNAVSKNGGKTKLVESSVVASNTKSGVEGYDWVAKCEVKFKKFENASQEPLNIQIGNVSKPPIMTVSTPEPKSAPQNNTTTTTATPATGTSTSGSDAPVTEDLSSNYTSVNQPDKTEKKSNIWLWLALAAAGGYLLNQSGKKESKS